MEVDRPATDESREIVAILDAGSQFGKVIDRRIRELNVESELIPFNTPADELRRYKAIVITGGPDSVYSETAPKCDNSLFDLGIPVLGICYGLQQMVYLSGGRIEKTAEREDGQYQLNIEADSALFAGLPSTIDCLLTHGDSVVDPGPGFRVVGTSSNGILAAAENVERKLYGIQFHPEVDLTPRGKDIFRNFLFGIAGCSGNFTLQGRQAKAIEHIRERVGDKKVLCLVSGGVDSSVCCALLRTALPPSQVYPVHIDSGMMRHEESANVKNALNALGIDVHVEDAESVFLNGTTEIDGVTTEKLCETVQPEVKRKIIGDVFMKLSDEIVRNQFGLQFEDMILAQGTLRPDLIESASDLANKGGTADVIKTHHNDTALVRALRDAGRVVEPLTDYHKDEVRALGEELGLPHELVWRQPFPGPGLGIRVICCREPFHTEHEETILTKLREFETDNVKCGLLGFRTVGVQGDGRTYSHCVSLSCTGPPPWSDLYQMAKAIPRTVHHINRVVFLFGDPVSGHEPRVTPTTLVHESIQQLRECDRIVNKALADNDLVHSLSQVPVILFPSNFGQDGCRSVCIRTFITNDFMTGVPAVVGKEFPEDVLNQLVEDLTNVPGIVRVGFDLTPKPPGTTEWE